MTRDDQDLEQLGELADSELLLVWGARSWITAYKSRRPICPKVRLGYRLAGAEDGLLQLDGLFSVLVRSTRRSLDFRCLNCPGLGSDEGLMLRCLAGLQYHDSAAALAVLESWLLPAQIEPAHRAAAQLAARLSKAGILMPVRRLRHPASMDLYDRPAGTCALH